MIKKMTVIVLVFVFTSAIGSAALVTTRPFVSGSISQILSSWENKPVMLVLWSVECPPCIHELDVLSELSNKHPNLNLVMISTDGVSYTHEIENTLQSHGLVHVESWVFAEENAQRLRYEIDRTWYGELPRTYFYDNRHRRSATSGVLTSQQIEAWLSSVSGSTDTAQIKTDLKESL